MTITMPKDTTESGSPDLAALFAAQQDRFASDATKPIEWRLDQISRLERLVGENQDAISEALAEDWKTASFEIMFEVGGMLGAIAATKAQLAGWMEPTEAPLPKALEDQGYSGRVYHDPYGTALLIGPFNAPITLLLLPLLTLLAGGNTAILKPSPKSGHVADLITELVPRYFDPADVTIVEGGNDVVTALLELPFDFIFFTGSNQVGKIVARAAAEHLTPTILELGGQNPSIVDETANLRDAARKLVWGAMAFGGQWCVSPGYVYVHESVAEEFVAEAKKAVQDEYGDDPKSNMDLSLIAQQDDVTRLAKLLEGANVVIGGDTDVEARYVAPTVLYPVAPDDTVMQAEIFGPILPILTYSKIDDAVAAIKRRPAPLSTYIFSQNKELVADLLNRLPFGGGAVNQTMLQLLFPSLPFGGVGASGWGQYNGKTGFDSVTHGKSVFFSPADRAIDVVIPPYDASTGPAFAQLMGAS